MTIDVGTELVARMLELDLHSADREQAGLIHGLFIPGVSGSAWEQHFVSSGSTGMKHSILFPLALSALMLATTRCSAQTAADTARSQYDAKLAASVGADERGMRRYVLVILKTGPTPVPKGPARDEMFKGHFANINRLAKERVLVQAGPLDGVDGWRGLFMFAVDSIETARPWMTFVP